MVTGVTVMTSFRVGLVIDPSGGTKSSAITETGSAVTKRTPAASKTSTRRKPNARTVIAHSHPTSCPERPRPSRAESPDLVGGQL